MSADGITKAGGVIEPGVVYHVEEAKRRLRWSKHAMRTARRRGLKVIHTANRAYVRGDDIIAYLQQILADDQTTSSK